MKDLYKEVQELNKLDPATDTERLAKFFEEAGELAQEVNKTNGRKTHNSTEEEIIKEITSEAADVIQNVFSLANGYGITLEDICLAMTEKNKKWKSKVEERQDTIKEKRFDDAIKTLKSIYIGENNYESAALIRDIELKLRGK